MAVRMIPPKKDELSNLIITQGMTPGQVSKKYGVCYATVRKWMLEYNIPLPLKNKPPIPSIKVMKKLYETQRLTIQDIADKYGVSRYTVKSWMDTYGIQSRASGGHRGGVRVKLVVPPELSRAFKLK